IHSYDPLVRKRAAMAFNVLDVPITKRTFSILLDALHDPELEVQLEIVNSIRTNCSKYSQRGDDNQIAIDPELINRAYAATKQIVVNFLSYSETSVRERAIFELIYDDLDEIELIPPLLGNLNQENLTHLLDHFYRFNISVNQSHLSILLEYLEDDRLELYAFALTNLGSISDDSILPILVSALKDDELIIRQAAVKGIARLKSSVANQPILLELAANSELVTILIKELWELSGSETQSTILEQWQNDRQFTEKFLEIAETTLIEIVETNHQGIRYLGQIGISDRAVDAIEEVLKSDSCSYENEDDGVLALASIGNNKAVNALLGFLPNRYVLGGWIAIQIHNKGKLGIIPRLWLAQRQFYSECLSDAIVAIQQREKLYNPNFSDRQDCELFESSSSYPRLRKVLLKDVNT
ncbi:MAG: HEAT repeat domain-containing protein, partial [Waterburya sp.]